MTLILQKGAEIGDQDQDQDQEEYDCDFEYCIFQTPLESSDDLFRLLRELEEVLQAQTFQQQNQSSNNGKKRKLLRRLVLEKAHWSPNAWRYLETILERYSSMIESLEFRSTFDPVKLQTLGKIERLILQYTPLGPFCLCLTASMQTVKELTVGSSTLSVTSATLFAQSYLSNPSCRLQSLDLSGTRFLDDASSCLANGLRDHGGSLQSLCLSECNLMDEQISAIVEGLVVCCRHITPAAFSLRELDISFNKSRHRSTTYLALLLKASTMIRKLSMGFQAFGEAKRIDLSPIFAALVSSSCHLTELDIGGNNLRDSDIPSLVDALCHNSTTLQILDVSANRFTNAGIALLAKYFSRMTTTLQQLIMEDIRDLDHQCIPTLTKALISSDNHTLHTIELDEKKLVVHSRKGNNSNNSNNVYWERLKYRLDLNWSGVRLLMQQESHRSSRCGGSNVPLALWPLVLQRVNNTKTTGGGQQQQQQQHKNMKSRLPFAAADIHYYLLREGSVFLNHIHNQ